MPELPEVETVVRGLANALVGRTILAATVHWPRTIAVPSVAEFKARIVGRQIVAVGRRGKLVHMQLDTGALLIHLKMSGRLRVVQDEKPLDSHTHTVFHLDKGDQLRFQDVRKFGRVHLVDEISQVTGKLGPEPLSETFALEDFRRLLARRTGRLKSLLMNQEFIAGLGNIYADETLFAAELHPLRKADSLTEEEQARLYRAMRSVLRKAVEARGTTLSDGGYLDAGGRAGAFQQQIAVYGRGGEPCITCGTAITRIIVGGRSTHFCPRCQVGIG